MTAMTLKKSLKEASFGPKEGKMTYFSKNRLINTTRTPKECTSKKEDPPPGCTHVYRQISNPDAPKNSFVTTTTSLFLEQMTIKRKNELHSRKHLQTPPFDHKMRKLDAPNEKWPKRRCSTVVF